MCRRGWCRSAAIASRAGTTFGHHTQQQQVRDANLVQFRGYREIAAASDLDGVPAGAGEWLDQWWRLDEWLALATGAGTGAAGVWSGAA